MAINFNDELKSYNERLLEDVVTEKDENFTPYDENAYNEKLNPTPLPDGSTEEEIEAYNTALLISQKRSSKAFNELPYSSEETKYKEKLGTENLQTDVDAQSLTQAERDILEDVDKETEGIQRTSILNPKDGNEKNYNETKYLDKLKPVPPPEDATEEELLSYETALLISQNRTNKTFNEREVIETPDSKDIDSNGADGENYNSIYQPLGSSMEGVGEIIARSVGVPASGDSEYEKVVNNQLNELDVFGTDATREEKSLTSDSLKFFLFNNVPYVIGQTANMISGVVDSVSTVIDNPSSLTNQWGTVRAAMDIANNIRYYTLAEGASSIITTFATLQLLPSMKGISVKYKRMSFTGGAAEAFSGNDVTQNISGIVPEDDPIKKNSGIFKDIQEWTSKTFSGLIDGLKAFFGGEQDPEVAENVAYLISAHKALESARAQFEDKIDAQIAEYFTRLGYFQKGRTQLQNKTGSDRAFADGQKLQSPTDDVRETTGGIDTTIPYIIKNSDISLYEILLKTSAAYRENGKIFDEKALQDVVDATKNSWKNFLELDKDNNLIETTIINIIKSKDTTLYKKLIEASYTDKDIQKRISDASNNSLLEMPELPNDGKDSTNEIIGLIKSGSDEDIISALESSPMKAGTGDDSKSVTQELYLERLSTIKGNIKAAYADLQNKWSLITGFKSIDSIGYIMVYPTLADGGPPSAFKIPFQFNPTISESGAGARYESQTLLHRQGNISSYVGTEGQTLSLETSYLMTTDGKSAEDQLTQRQKAYNSGDDGDKKWEDSEGPQDAWYSKWTPVAIQAIERALRSIVLPQIRGGGDTDIKFHKPPMVKIVFGTGSGDVKTWEMGTTGKYQLHPMLTYPIQANDNTKFYHRTYLVTKVTITKDVTESPLHLDDNGNLMDTHGFKVQMELSEVDSNYVGIMPSFGEYYSSYFGQLDLPSTEAEAGA